MQISLKNRGMQRCIAKNMQQTYVKQGYQKQGIGKVLLEERVAFAKSHNYSTIMLNTLNNMVPAIKLYKQYGFFEIPAFYYNPNTTAVYFKITC